MLTELQVKNVRPKEKTFMLRDERGLYLRVVGPYLDLSLKDARIMRDGIQTDRAKGKSPTLKTTHIPQLFSEAAQEWLNIRMKDKAESYIKPFVSG